MPLPTDQFKAQARRGGRRICWRLEAGVAVFLALFVGLLGVLLFSSAVWFGIIALLLAIAIIVYSFRRIFVGRHRDLFCPACGIQGEVIKIEQSYQFHCR